MKLYHFGLVAHRIQDDFETFVDPDLSLLVQMPDTYYYR